MSIRDTILATIRNDPEVFLSVITTDRDELNIAEGRMFTGRSVRSGVTSPDTYYSAIVAPADKYAVIEDFFQVLDFGEANDGDFVHEVTAFVKSSATSDFTYTPNNPLPIGRAMISSKINDFPTTTVDLDVNVTTLTGEPEYALSFANFFIDTSGNRNLVSQNSSEFFGKNRQLILAPNEVGLVRAVSTGTLVGTVDIRTIFFVTEVPVSRFPE